MIGDIKANIARRDIWLRLVFMIVLSVAFNLVELLTAAVAVFQFLASMFTGRPNDRLSRFGRSLARYLRQITVYVTFATEDKPFPFAPWPDEPDEEAPTKEDDSRPNDAEAGDNEKDADRPKD